MQKKVEIRWKIVNICGIIIIGLLQVSAQEVIDVYDMRSSACEYVETYRGIAF